MSFSLSTMRLEVLQFIAGFCGALGSVFLLLSLGTDYWLLASESCDPGDKITTRLRRSTTEDGLQEHQDGPKHVVLAYHEGVFWRCSYVKEIDREEDSMLDFWISRLKKQANLGLKRISSWRSTAYANQPSEKICTPAYLSQVPLSGISTSDSATVHRAFWCIMSVLGLTMVTLGVFVTICGIPTASRRLYEAGGALFITGGLLIFLVVGTFAAWVQGSSTLEQYVLQRRLSACPSLHLSVHYGLSFMLAPAASFFCLLCGLLILLMQTASRAESASAAREPPSVQEGWQVSTL
ncbi:transmembrane protein 182 isoform X2 [Pygocentrus nattereri]|uniref:transmembrane protein 182 isoform X2 n=1 Tax=Pygocentrus nattereri TaxID=42514 RepID=UPI00081471F9|nr:transmembrane protein 182 isoform X2 [Pygocentrus nattereri]